MKRRFPQAHLDALAEEVGRQQHGFCACCGEGGLALSLDWSLDQTNDDGVPLYRGAICRSCKIAVGRLEHPSRFVLVPKVLARTERYLERRWSDPVPVLEHLGLRRNLVAEQAEREAAGRRSRTDETIEFLASLGVKVG